jgi:hypothetical protein
MAIRFIPPFVLSDWPDRVAETSTVPGHVHYYTLLSPMRTSSRLPLPIGMLLGVLAAEIASYEHQDAALYCIESLARASVIASQPPCVSGVEPTQHDPTRTKHDRAHAIRGLLDPASTVPPCPRT